MNDCHPGPDGAYRFWFVTARPPYPAPEVPGTCRYVEDFQEAFADVTVRPLDDPRSDHKQLFNDAWIGDKK